MYRIGQGIDVHPFCDGDSVTLGGVKIPHSKSLLGHSDADVLIHAIMDAILGAAGLPDIGFYFPPCNPKYKGASSIELLKEVVSKVSGEYKIVNIDSTVLAEKPKILPHYDKMKEMISSAVGISKGCIGIKATTTEQLGFVGREEGIVAQAVVLLEKIS